MVIYLKNVLYISFLLILFSCQKYGGEYDIMAGTPRIDSPRLAVLEVKWKLFVNDDGSGVELYNLQDDPAEIKNLAKDNPNVATRLTIGVLNWKNSLPRLNDLNHNEYCMG